MEWLGRKIGFEIFLRFIEGDESRSDSELEDELSDALLSKSVVINEPDQVEDSETLVDIPEKITGEIISVNVKSDDGGRFSIVAIAFEQSLTNYLPDDDKMAENALSFWLEKDDISLKYNSSTRLGPIISVYIPSVRRSQVELSTRIVSKVASQTIYLGTTQMHFVFEALEAGLERGTGIDQLDEEIDELSREEIKEAIRVLTGSVSGHDPEYQLDSDG